MATPNYTNNAHPDIAYLLVFNNIFLQERVRLRIVCQRWKSIIEDDCAQMTTLCVFRKPKDPKDYFLRTQYHAVKPIFAELQPEESSNHAPTRWNTIILKRLSKSQVDVLFLVRLFPAIQNLALAWVFDGKKDENTMHKNEKDATEMKAEEIIDPDIFGLLTSWAPNLRELFFETNSYTPGPEPSYLQTIIREYYKQPIICLEEDRTSVFWGCIALMAPTLQKLTLGGVDLTTAPESLVLPSLEEMAYYNRYIRDGKYGKYGNLLSSPHRLHKLAPILRSIRLTIGDIWDWQLPETVSQLAVLVDLYNYASDIVPCPSITHLVVESFGFTKSSYLGEFSDLLKKFPNTKSLAFIELNNRVEDNNISRWLARKGKKFESVGFLSALARCQPGPFVGIEELYLSPFTAFYYMESPTIFKKKGYDAIFRGIAATFRGLKKLTLAIGPHTEEGHRESHRMFTALKGRYMPGVELAFALEMDAEMRYRAFKGSDYHYHFGNSFFNREETPIPNRCHLSPGCVFVRQADAEQLEKPNLNKKQRTK